MCSLRSWTAALVLGGLSCSLPALANGIFTGPVSAYYLTDSNNNNIYVVQGNKVINTFPMAYGTTRGEWPIAISGDNVRTIGPELSQPGGSYTLNGTPTGATFWNVMPGEFGDGTSDGVHNYTVPMTSGFSPVYATELNWSNPRILFALPTGPHEGITYDKDDNSIWVGTYGYVSTLLEEYSLSGSLLSMFPTQVPTMMTALSYDPQDHTLWFSVYGTNILEQYSTTGVHLQEGIPTGLPAGVFYGGEQVAPEPGSLSLIGLGGVLIWCGRLRRHAKQ